MNLLLINTFAWLLLQLSIAAIAVRLGEKRFARDNWFYRVRPVEISFYKRWLRIRRWKGRLPDAAPWVGGDFSKKVLRGKHSSYLERLMIETRRGEIAHWIVMA